MNHPRENILNIILKFHSTIAFTTTIIIDIIQYIYTIMCVYVLFVSAPLLARTHAPLPLTHSGRGIKHWCSACIDYFVFNSASMSLTASGFFWVSAPSISASQSSPSHFFFFPSNPSSFFFSSSSSSDGTSIPSKPW